MRVVILTNIAINSLKRLQDSGNNLIMSLYMETRVTMLLSEVYIFAPIKPCIYLLKTVSSVLSSAYFCGNLLWHSFFVWNPLRRLVRKMTQVLIVIHYKLTFLFKLALISLEILFSDICLIQLYQEVLTVYNWLY